MISYNSQDISFEFKGKRANNAWLKQVVLSEGKTLGEVSIVFCSDDYLLGVNKQFLKHDYYTDIITFDYCEGSTVSGDLLISIDTVRANASAYGVSFLEELRRVMVHGILHLLTYDDHCESDIAVMRSKENFYLKHWDTI